MCDGDEHQYLKELVLRYISFKEPHIFEAILVQVDKLLLYTIHKIRWQLPYLKKVEIQDLYQDAIVGLHKGLLKVKPGEPGTKILYWIVRSVKNEILDKNKRRKEINFSSFGGSHSSACYLDRSSGNPLVDNTPVYKNLELINTRERFWKLIDEGVISLSEFQMLSMRVVQNMTYRDIAFQVGQPLSTVSKKITNLLYKLRYEFRRRGWEDT